MIAHFGDLKGRTIAVWGLAFKPRTDDMREAPAITDHRAPARRSARRCGPTIPRPRRPRGGIFGDRITFCDKSYDALTGADALAIVTEWNEFREPDFKKMRSC